MAKNENALLTSSLVRQCIIPVKKTTDNCVIFVTYQGLLTSKISTHNWCLHAA